MKRKALFLSLGLICILIYYKTREGDHLFPVSKLAVQNFKVPRAFNTAPIDLGELIDSARYIEIENRSDFGSIAKVEISKDRIFILDGSKAELSVFSGQGKFIKKINRHIKNFQLYGEGIVVYDPDSASIFSYDINGRVAGAHRIGYHGLEMLKISENLYAFYTAGLKTSDRESEKYEFVLTDSAGQVSLYLFPILENNRNLRFSVPKRLQSFNSVNYLCTTYGPEIYNINSSRVSAMGKVQFGGYQLPEDNLREILLAENIYMFPYVYDLTVLAASKEKYFLSYTFKGKTCFAILDRADPQRSNYGEGIILPKGHESTNFIPVGVSGNFFIGSQLLNAPVGKASKSNSLTLALYHFKLLKKDY